jgi:hypothetical protein
MLDNIKLLLGDAAANYTDAQMQLYYDFAKAEVETYCNRKVEDDPALKVCAQRIAVISLNRQNTEGLASQSVSGVSESYTDGYPADIMAVLNRKRRLKVL